MATPAQIKKRDKYADKPKQVINNNIRLNLGEHNHIDYETFNSKEYNKALARATEKDPFTRGGTTFWMESNREPITLLIEK